MLVTWLRWLPCPYMVKTLKKSSFQVPLDWFWWNFVWSIRDLSPLYFVQIMTLGWPWPILWQEQILQLRLLYGKMWQWWLLWKLLHPVTWNLVILGCRTIQNNLTPCWLSGERSLFYTCFIVALPGPSIKLCIHVCMQITCFPLRWQLWNYHNHEFFDRPVE